jgi:tRNA pseudouridine55 synthase
MARGRRRGRPIDGWLAIDKPEGETSTRMVSVVRRITGAAKAGHGGTLDPLATGVLPIALGEATKTVAYVMDAPKTYRFRIRFGEARDTDDALGRVIARSDLRPTREAIEALLPEFQGVIQQRPPNYAAVKVDGERAYDRARRGETLDLAPRPVRIDALELIDLPDPDHAVLELVCGKGAYVRALARDLGERLGCLGHVESLRRTAVGAFTEDLAVRPDVLERIVADDNLLQILVPLRTALADIPALALTEPQAQRLRSGQTVRVAPGLVIGEPDADGTIRAMQEGELVALARLQGGELSPLRVFNLRPRA